MSIENLSKILNGLGIRRINLYGDVMKGICPFHKGSSGKTFWLHPESGRWGCWSTRCPKHSGGSLLDLAYALGASDLQKNLLKDYAKNILSTSSYSGNTLGGPTIPSNIRELDDAGTLRESHIIGWQINSNSAKYPDIRKFLLGRGIPLELLEFFSIGFCNISNSLIFPLRSPDGGLLGICRRKPEVGERYYFSGSPYPNTHPNYTYVRVEKTKCLWGMSEQAESIAQGKPVVVVEGFFDVLRLRSYGVVAVAKLGSKLTATQAEVICGLSNKIVLWPDNDKAGISGVAEDVSRLLLHPDVNCVIPETSDPGETSEPEAIRALTQAVSGPKFLSRLTEILYT